jgi:NADH dehydrogenase
VPPSRTRDAIFGAIAGAIGGLLLALALQAKGMMSDTAGLIGLTSIESGIAIHLLISAIAGAGYGALFRYLPGTYAAAISNGVIYGLIWWIVGPLTLSPILMGHGPSWSLNEAGTSFLNLTGHILYGGFTGICFYALATIYEKLFPETLEASQSPAPPLTRIVIVGGGFGGVGTTQRLEKLISQDERFDVTLLSESNYLLFTPMLPEVASSALLAQHISTPVRAACPNTRFLRATVSGIDTQNSKIRLFPGVGLPLETMEYDHLVLALGSVPFFHGLKSIEEHVFSIKTLDDATRLRNHVLAVLERADGEPDPEKKARQLTFVVVGGGFAGTEVIAELFDLTHGVLHYYPGIAANELRFILIHSREQILPELSKQLGDYSLQKLRRRGIEFLLGTRASEATPDALILDGGSRIETNTIIWTAGNRAHPMLETIPCELNSRGAVIADKFMRVKGLKNVWALGDCAEVNDQQGNPYPQTAQHALRQGKLVAENIVATVNGERLKEFRYRSVGMLVALGHRTGAAEIMGRPFSGFLAWILWRGLYLSKLPGLEKKVRVLLDWTLDLVFSRDIVLTSDSIQRTTAHQSLNRVDRLGDS